MSAILQSSLNPFPKAYDVIYEYSPFKKHFVNSKIFLIFQVLISSTLLCLSLVTFVASYQLDLTEESYPKSSYLDVVQIKAQILVLLQGFRSIHKWCHILYAKRTTSNSNTKKAIARSCS